MADSFGGLSKTIIESNLLPLINLIITIQCEVITFIISTTQNNNLKHGHIGQSSKIYLSNMLLS